MYIAKRPCRFSGKQFVVGEQIPDEVIAPGRAEALAQSGLIEYIENKPDNNANKTMIDQSGGNPCPKSKPRQNAQKTGKTGQAKKTASAAGKKVERP